MRIDVLTSISGVSFDEAWKSRTRANFNEHTVGIIGRKAFIKNKRAAARPKDLVDIALLEEVDEPLAAGTRRPLAAYESGHMRLAGARKRRK